MDQNTIAGGGDLELIQDLFPDLDPSRHELLNTLMVQCEIENPRDWPMDDLQTKLEKLEIDYWCYVKARTDAEKYNKILVDVIKKYGHGKGRRFLVRKAAEKAKKDGIPVPEQ